MKNITATQIIEALQKMPKAGHDSPEYYEVVIFEEISHSNVNSGIGNAHILRFRKEYLDSGKWDWVIQNI